MNTKITLALLSQLSSSLTKGWAGRVLLNSFILYVGCYVCAYNKGSSGVRSEHFSYL